MQTHDLEPGSPEWHAHRAKHFNASDAPAMMGVDPNRSRNELLQQMHSGITPEFTDWVQENILNAGHRYEALARPIAEEVIGEDLFPTVGTNGDLSASYDGINAGDTLHWEHKRLNSELRAVMTERATGADLPLRYRIQLEHQCMVAGTKRALFTASEWDGEDCIDVRHVWYTSNPELAGQILAGWKQFHADLQAYVPPKAKPEPTVKKVVKGLPALVIDIKGEVRANNLPAYQAAAIEYIAGINTKLKTDQDFADAAAAVLFCQASEDRLKLVKEQALAQAASIEALFSTIDVIAEEFRQKRLELDKLVTRRKDEIKREIAEKGQAELDNHVKTLNERLGTAWIPRRIADFGTAMKGKRTVDSLDSAVDNLVATEKIALSAMADRLALNRKALIDGDRDYFFLFADFAAVGLKAAEDFSAIALMRISTEKARLQKVIDDQKAADDEKARKAQEAAAAPPAVEPTVAAQLAALPVVGKLESVGGPGSGQFKGTGVFAAAAHGFDAGLRAATGIDRPPSGRPPLTSSELNALVGDGFGMTVSFITGTLKIQPVPTPANKRVGSGTYWGADDVPKILAALSQHLADVERIYCGDIKKVG